MMLQMSTPPASHSYSAFSHHHLRLPLPHTSATAATNPIHYASSGSTAASSPYSTRGTSTSSSPVSTAAIPTLPPLNLPGSPPKATTAPTITAPIIAPSIKSSSGLGPLAAAVTLRPLPKAGRKPLTTPPKDNRQRQNREAQRTYRKNQRDEMQSLREKESGWTRTARDGKALLEDVIRATEQLPFELRGRIPTHALNRLHEDLSKWSGDDHLGYFNGGSTSDS